MRAYQTNEIKWIKKNVIQNIARKLKIYLYNNYLKSNSQDEKKNREHYA